MNVNKHIDCCLRVIDFLNKNSERINSIKRRELIIYLIDNGLCESSKAIENAIRELNRLEYLSWGINGLTINLKLYERSKDRIANFKKGSPKLPEFVKRLEEYQTITREELNNLFIDFSIQELDQIILKLQKIGVIQKLFGERSRQKYFVIKNDSANGFITNPIKEIVTLFGENVTFCYHTALQIHGLSRYAMSYEIFIDKKIPSKESKISPYKIKSIVHLAEEVGRIKMKYGEVLINLTDKERTLIDCIHRPKYAVGWENIVYAFNAIETIDTEKVYGYLKKIKIRSLYSKVGFILELNRERWNINENSLQEIRMFKTKNPIRFFRDNPGKYNERWNIFIPENLMDI